MFEDEMTEDHMARTEAEYQRVTEQEIMDEKLAQFKALAAGIAGVAASLCRNCKDQIDDGDVTFCGMCREMGCRT